MIRSKGIKIVGGTAIGVIRLYKTPNREINPSPAADPVYEQVRFESARKTVMAQRRELRLRTHRSLGKKEAAIFEAHEMILEDQRFIDQCENMILEQNRRADMAVSVVMDSLVRDLQESDEEGFRARSSDILDLKRSFLDVLSGVDNSWEHGDRPVIIAAEELAPSQLINLDKEILLGIVTRKGSPFSHTAILAKSLNIPFIIGCEDISSDWDGRKAALDADEQCVYIEPSPEIRKALTRKQEAEKKDRAELLKLKGQDNVTIDGHHVELWANIGAPQDIKAVLDNDADGIGLFRSEFIYLGRDAEPSEFEQVEAYRSVIEGIAPGKVIIRICDLGSDKLPGYMFSGKEENPALGCRGIRFCLTHRETFKRQLRALLRAAAFGGLGIMIPMVMDINEILKTKELLRECSDELTKEGLDHKMPRLGIMIETPAAAICADELAKEVDFFSIGTNDLTQYACALDRQTPGLEDVWDAHHPAVFKLIEMAVKAGHDAGIPVGICGELASDTEVTGRLLQMGVDVLSVDPSAVLPLRRRIRGLKL